MDVESFGGLIFLEGAAVGIAFAVRTKRFIPTSILRALACIGVGYFFVPRLGNVLWRLAGQNMPERDAMLVAHLPFVALTFALLLVGIRGLINGERKTAAV